MLSYFETDFVPFHNYGASSHCHYTICTDVLILCTIEYDFISNFSYCRQEGVGKKHAPLADEATANDGDEEMDMEFLGKKTEREKGFSAQALFGRKNRSIW